MKNNKLIVLIILALFALFVSGCADPGANQEANKSKKNRSTKQDDEISKDIGNTINNSVDPVSAWYFEKWKKAASNLSWAAVTRMAVICQMYRWDPYIKDKTWQGDMSEHYYRGNRNAKPSDYYEMRDTIRAALQYYGGGYAHGINVMPGASNSYANLFYRVLYAGVPVIILRRDKTNYNNYWALIIYAMPNANGGQETISVYDPEHDWTYTCALKGFCDDARYYDSNTCQMAIWPNYGPAAGPLRGDAAWTPEGTY
jgi:hypothetical protein